MITVALAILLFVCVAHIGISLFVLLQNTRSRTNLWFFSFIITMVAWLLSNYYSNDMALSYGSALLINKAVFAFPALTIFSLAKFAISFTDIRVSRWRSRLLNAVGVFVAAVSLTPYVVQGIAARGGVYEINFGPLAIVFFGFILICFGIGIWVLWRAYRRSRGADRSRLQYVLLSLLVGLGIAIFTNAILPSVLNNYSLSSAVGPVATIIISVGFAYAIIRHRLFDIRQVVARSVAYVLLLLTLAGIYGLAIFSVTRVLFPSGSANSGQSIVSIALAIILAFTFQPLKRFFEHITDTIFFRDRFDSQQVLNQVGQILVTEFKLDGLLRQALSKICRELKIASGQLYVFDEDRVYKVEHYGALPAKLITAPHLKALHHKVLVSDELVGGHEKDVMQEFGYRVVMHLDTKEEFVGYLLLGDKLSGDIYTPQDITLLEILIQELAVAISNSKAYEDIAQFNLTLQQKIDDATKRLKVANQNLRELDEAKDEFISMASHQLRTPLTSIKGYLSMVLEGDTGKITPQQQEFLNYAFTGAQRTVNMISDLLNVSRMTAGKFMIERSEVDLAKLVGEEVQQLQQMAESRQLTLKFVPPKKALPTMQLDEGKTRQVVMNFVDNALHYTKKGEVVVSLQEVKKSAELRVKDSGIGVPKEARPHLFSKFYRAGNAQTARPDGTGLGLFLAKRVVEDQGGTIIFESVEGKGSTFGFTIPLTVKESRGTDKQPPGK
jgi:signal transduction histidine kinase